MSAEPCFDQLRDEETDIHAFHKKESLIDFPGHISQMLFTSGCNFYCSYCHNRSLWKKRDQGLTMSRLREILTQARSHWCDAVCISGGEPTIHDSLTTLIPEIRRMGFKVKLDTNGSRPQMVEALLPWVDYFAMDLKAPLERYRDVVNVPVDLQSIEASIRLIIGGARDYEFRTTVIDGIHRADDIEAICRAIKGARRYFLQPFVPKEELLGEEFTRVSRSRVKNLEDYASLARRCLPETDVRIRI